MSRPICNMGRGRYALVMLLVLCPLALTRHDDDFAFDSEEIQLDLQLNHSDIRRNSLRRLWGVPDTSAYVGHLFRMEIPKEAFTGEVLAYKVRTEHGRRTPSWMAVDSKHGLISGVPMSNDVGTHAFTVTVHGRKARQVATDNFVIEVKKAEEKSQSKYGYCHSHQNKLMLMLLIDQPFSKIAPRNKIRALMELSHFMALDADEFWIEPYKMDKRAQHAVISSGPGTSNKRRGDSITAIYLNVGCGSTVWSRHRVLVAGLREQSRDGTLSHLLRLPLLGWRLVAIKPQPRLKRQLSHLDDGGSGGYEYDDDGGDDDDDVNYSGYDDDDYDDTPILDNNHPPPNSLNIHPHRHHHGDTPPPPGLQPASATASATAPATASTATTSATSTATSTANATSTVTTTASTTALTTEGATTQLTTKIDTTTNEFTTEIKPSSDHKVNISPIFVTESTNREVVSVNPRRLEHSPVLIVPETSTEQDAQTVIIRASNEVPLPSSTSTTTTTTTARPTTRLTTVSTTTAATTLETNIPSTRRAPSSISWFSISSASTTSTPRVSSTLSSLPPITYPLTTSEIPETTTELVPTTSTDESSQENTIPVSTEGSSTIIGRTTETVTFPMPVNQPPTLKHHMKKLAIAAGKAFRYIIPPDLFIDPEDGNNLSFSMYDTDNVKLSNNSWIQFMAKEREVYGLPLESHVSRWSFIIEAKDSEGAIARGPLDITVQQHKIVRTLTHEFGITFKLNKIYQRAIDWQIRLLEGLVNLFRDIDMNNITVLNVTQNGDVYEFVWANDSLPRDDPSCPKEEVNRLMKVLESSPGKPSPLLSRSLSPALSPLAVWVSPRGRCESHVPPGPVPLYPPVSRNQVDYVRATVGHLLVYTVPEDTFYDPEDGGTRNLHLSLRNNDRSELLASDWLQFDANNQEFYGLPMATDVGSKMYQLVAEDSSKKSAYDSLVVEVLKAPAIAPTVEFQMTLEYPIEHTASVKRKVVEKLAALFGDKDTDSIRIHRISDNPTTIIWYNTSLPMDRCPKKEIEQLREMIITDERSGGALRENVDQIFDKDFKVMSITLIPLGLCAEQHTKTSVPSHTNANVKGSKAGSAEGSYSDYLVTFIIPIVFIVCMILVASIIACVLYRRKRTGKMSVGDEEERQAFRSKGIPVIFQDELEEQAGSEPLHKSPVIMREEKPPLLPPAPDYRQGSDSGDFRPSAPYRPPPPVSAANPPPRPKATPTYRKPPPYVPP